MKHNTQRATLGVLVGMVMAGVLWPVWGLAAEGRRVTIGTGSGYLKYPDAQETLKLRPGDTVYVAAGKYGGISLGNMAGTAEAPITVMCDPEAVFTTPTPVSNDFTNLAFVRFENFRYEKYNAGCMKIGGNSHDLLFKNFTIKEASGYCFHVYDANKVFDGTKASTFYNFKWENCLIDGKVNGHALTNTDYNIGNLKSVVLDFEVYKCTFRNFDNTLQAFGAIAFDKCFNLQVHECNFSDMGMAKSPIGHNVCIVGAGYFKVYNNRFTRQWANDVRVFPMKLNALGYDGPEAVNRFYNNISWEKRKYPMYEHNNVRQADLDKAAPWFSRTSSEVYFNTMYRSRIASDSKDPYRGTLVDVYSPEVTVKYNLVIDPESDMPWDPKRDYVCHLGSGPQKGVVIENNLVVKTLPEAGLADLETFVPTKTSPARNAATGRVSYITKDHYGNERYRGTTADLGAVEAKE